MKKQRWLASMLAATVAVSSMSFGAFAVEDNRASVTQSASEAETVFVSAYGGAQRTVSFDQNWKFNLGDISGAQETVFNDSAWRNVDLPHDYSIEQEYTSAGEAESGYLPGGTGWYRKSFMLGEDWKNKVVSVEFGGVYMNATIFLNGEKLGTHPYGYTPFSFVLPSDKLNYGSDNVLAVRTENKVPSSRWYSGSGIYRSVKLTATDPVHIGRYGVTVTTPNIKTEYAGGAVTVDVSTVVQNDGTDAADISVRNSVYEKGETAPETTGDAAASSVAAGASVAVESQVSVSGPSLWSPSAPNLYTVRTEILRGEQVIDTVDTDFGFRWTDWDANKGFSLNGQMMKLEGVCMHHDQGALGAEGWYRAMERQVEILKEMGCNAIRVTHNPAADELIEICNEKGMLVVDEAFDTWKYPKNGNVNDNSATFQKTIESGNAIVGGEPGSMTWGEFDTKAMVARGKNSPAVIMWSLGNEIFEGCSSDATYPQIAQDLIDWVLEVDSTRYVTFGDNKLHGFPGNTDRSVQIGDKLTTAGGAVGGNYNSTSDFDSLHNNRPNWLIYGAETASSVNSRGVYDRQTNNGDGGKGDKLLTSYDTSAVGWGKTASDAWYTTIISDYNAGEFVWTGFDYIGEPTPWNGTGSGWVSGTSSPKSSYFGIVDTAGFPKDNYYFYQSQWNEDVNTLHILPTWNESDVLKNASGNVEVVVYSDARSVELFFTPEGSTEKQSLGQKTFDVMTTPAGYTYQIYSGEGKYSTQHRNLYLGWSVPYAPGTLTAVAYDADGKIISDTEGRSSVTTTGAAKKLALSADREAINADKRDLSYVTIDVTDANGNIVNGAKNTVELSISGDGVILGTDNGLQPDHTSYQSLTRNAHAGKLLAIVQSTGEGGGFTVTAKSNGLEAGSVTVGTNPVADSGEKRVVSYTISKNYYVKVGAQPVLPAKITANFSDGSQEELPVAWNEISAEDIGKVGTFAATGKLGDTGVTVSVNVNMLEQIAALLNYSAALLQGTSLSLPATRPAILANGEVLTAQFAVDWDITGFDSKREGVQTIPGTAEVFGQSIPVSAFVRVGAGDITVGANVAPQARSLTANIGGATPSDTLEAIRDGEIAIDPNTAGGPNPSAWSNYAAAQAGINKSSLTYEYDTAQNLGQATLFFFTDSYATALPDEVTFEWSANGDEWQPISAQAGADTNPSDRITERTYTFSPVPAVFLRVNFTDKAGNPAPGRNYCTGLTELKLNVVTSDFSVNSSADLTSLTVNGRAVDAAALAAKRYQTPEYFAKTVEATSDANAAYTVLPVQDDVVRVLTESEDHSRRATYTIELRQNPAAGMDPADAAKDYPVAKLTAEVGSFQPNNTTEGGGNLALDGDYGTLWHTKWSENLTTTPEKRYITLTLAEATELSALRYYGRSGAANGRVNAYKVEVSTDGTTWTQVSSGKWANSAGWKIAVFDEPVTAKYVKLSGVSTYGDGSQANMFMSAAEVRVRTADTAIDISGAAVSVDPTRYDYTGKPIEPKPVVVLGEKTLEYGIDYVVSYLNNIEAGTATVTVRGILDYSGTATAQFTIGDDALTVVSYAPITVDTLVGEAPELPAQVTARMSTGPDKSFAVIWDNIDPASYAATGSFKVQGTVAGQTLKPEAEIIVSRAVAAQNISAATLPGTAATLPATVAVYMSDGTTKMCTVTWENASFDGEAGSLVAVKGTVQVSANTTLPVTASVRLAEGTELGNIARKTSSELPLALSSIMTTDSPNNINDGTKTFNNTGNKQIWSDWVRNTYHDAPWVGIILNGEHAVNKISIGFIDEVASGNPEVQGSHAVRIPQAYKVQYYAGPEYTYVASNNGKVSEWANSPLNDNSNWHDVAGASYTELPDSKDFAQMLDVTFSPVKTDLIRVVMTPYPEQWVGVDELEVFAQSFDTHSDFAVSAITIGGEDKLAQFDEEHVLTVTAAGGELPAITAQATNNASVTILPATDISGETKIIFTPENGDQTKAITYTVRYTAIAGEFTISYDYAGGKLPEGKENPLTYTEKSEAITLVNPEREGYTFTGWIGTGLDGTKKTVVIPQGSTGNRSYTAVWGGAPTPSTAEVRVTGFDRAYFTDPLTFGIGLANMERVGAASFEFDLNTTDKDGVIRDLVAGNGIEGLEGFMMVGDIKWTQNENGTWHGAFTVVCPGTGKTITELTNIVKLSFADKGFAGFVEFSLSAVKVAGFDEQGNAVYLANTVATTSVKTKYSSRYDFDLNSKTDILDLTMMMPYYMSSEGSTDWSLAKQFDVTNDGRVDMDDMLLVLVNFSV